MLHRNLRLVQTTVEVVKKEIDQIFYDYEERAANKYIDIDGFKLAIKRGLLSVAKNAQDVTVSNAEATCIKIAKIEGQFQDHERRYCSLVQQVADRTERLEHMVLQKTYSEREVTFLQTPEQEDPSAVITEDHKDTQMEQQSHATKPSQHTDVRRSVNAHKNAVRVTGNHKSKPVPKPEVEQVPTPFKVTLDEMASHRDK